MTIPKGLLIAGGLGALGVGGFMLLKGGDDKPKEGEAADPAPGGAGVGTGTAAGVPGAATPGGLPTAGTSPLTGGAGAGQQGPVGQQVGPYTVVQDPQSGMQVVLETATQQPVGILDEQGNVIPVQMDAQGNLSVAPQQGQLAPAGNGGMPLAATPTNGLDAGSAISASPLLPGSGTGAPTAASAHYALLAEALFAQAGNASVGTATSDAMAGTTALAPQSSVMTQGQAQALMPQSQALAPQSQALAPQSQALTPQSQALAPQSQQVGAYTVVADPASGQQVVVETATQQPVGVLDAQGNVIPLVAEQTTASALGMPSVGAGLG